MEVRDVMTRDVISVPPSLPLKDVARLLSEHRISGVPVVDTAGEIIGVVSEGDILMKQRGRPVSRRGPLDCLFGERLDRAGLRRRAAHTASQAMSSPAISIGADRSLREAAALMVDRAINRLPVMSDGRLVGIVTRADLVRAYLRQDDETLQVIRDQVIRHTMWLDPDDIRIEVRDGHVRLAGTVDRRSTATILEKLIGLVDGVDHIENFLTWEFDDRALPAGEAEPEPGASSLTARERPRPLHG